MSALLTSSQVQALAVLAGGRARRSTETVVEVRYHRGEVVSVLGPPLGSVSPGAKLSTGVGTVYLLCFAEPPGGPGPRAWAGHYLGWTTDLDGRLAEHRAGQGARLMAAVATAGAGFALAHDDHTDGDLAIAIPRLCPLCRARRRGTR